MKKILILAISLMISVYGLAQEKGRKTMTKAKSSKTIVKKVAATATNAKKVTINDQALKSAPATKTITTVETKKTEVKTKPTKDSTILTPTKKGSTYYIDERGVKTYVGS